MDELRPARPEGGPGARGDREHRGGPGGPGGKDASKRRGWMPTDQRPHRSPARPRSTRSKVRSEVREHGARLDAKRPSITSPAPTSTETRTCVAGEYIGQHAANASLLATFVIHTRARDISLSGTAKMFSVRFTRSGTQRGSTILSCVA